MSANSPSVLITGATGKLGKTFALGFAGLGYDVAFTTRGGAAADELEKACAAAGAPRVLRVDADLTAADASRCVVDRLREADLLPHVLINNARDTGYLEPDDDGRMPRAHWQGEFLLGVILPYELSVTLASQLATRLHTVINIASMYGVTAPNLSLYDHPELDSSVNYGVTKAALIHLTRELAVRLAPRTIRVNAVSYGGVSGRADEAFEERYAQLCPAGRMLDDSDVFGPVKFLASADASGMTGHNLVVDGGWTIW